MTKPSAKSADPDDLVLIANNRSVSGWEEISVTLRTEGFPPSFDLTLSSIDPVTSSSILVRPGDPCVVKLGVDQVISGYVDRYSDVSSPSGHKINIVGRGKTQDLVDCSGERDTGQFTNVSALDVAKILAAP